MELESLAGTQIMHQIKIISLKTRGLFEDHLQKNITPQFVPLSQADPDAVSFENPV